MLAAILIVILLTITLGWAAVGNAVVSRHRAQAAADLAALAGAAALPAGREAACSGARELSAAMRAAVVACDIVGLDVTVRVEVAALVGVAQASARAGPVG